MPVNAAAENMLGTIGTICWTGQIIPQIWKSWREKSTEGLSHWLMPPRGLAATFLGVFNVTQNLNIPLIVQPQLFGFLSIVSWSQCMYYGHKKTLFHSICLLICTLVTCGAFEAGMIFAIRPAKRSGNDRPVQFFGVTTSILLSAGLFPQYVEIYRYREVIGISIVFMSIDMAGGVFSVLSLIFKEKFDILASISYSLVVVLDGVVLILAVILNPRANRRRLANTEAEEANLEDRRLPLERYGETSVLADVTSRRRSGLDTGLGETLASDGPKRNQDGSRAMHGIADDKRDL